MLPHLANARANHPRAPVSGRHHGYLVAGNNDPYRLDTRLSLAPVLVQMVG